MRNQQFPSREHATLNTQRFYSTLRTLVTTAVSSNTGSAGGNTDDSCAQPRPTRTRAQHTPDPNYVCLPASAGCQDKIDPWAPIIVPGRRARGHSHNPLRAGLPACHEQPDAPPTAVPPTEVLIKDSALVAEMLQFILHVMSKASGSSPRARRRPQGLARHQRPI